MEGKAAGELSTAHSDLPELWKRLSARMGSRHTAPLLRRRLPYPVVDRLPESKIHPWRKSPCGANAAGRRCARIRKSIAAVPAISEPWKKHTVSRYARGAGKNFRSMQVKNASIAAGTAPAPHRLRQRIFAEASGGFSIQNRKAGQSISSRQREKQSWIVTASASGLYAERPACTQGLTA